MDPCKKFACELQKCLANNSYNEDKCTQIVHTLNKCCLENYILNPNRYETISPTCSGFVSQFDTKHLDKAKKKIVKGL
ncbi:unnamed protein product [Brachionus calyciflorus]|uniref:Cx9C motif-containing protein 4 n=1 Tax=Brachionus calyciflorus TaxID=104777 RepID=A0A814DSM1_9BILA|nr:unnamed protein product [Brachionus calyciflorus]